LVFQTDAAEYSKAGLLAVVFYSIQGNNVSFMLAMQTRMIKNWIIFLLNFNFDGYAYVLYL
jgi:hypothetical protein